MIAEFVRWKETTKRFCDLFKKLHSFWPSSIPCKNHRAENVTPVSPFRFTIYKPWKGEKARVTVQLR